VQQAHDRRRPLAGTQAPSKEPVGTTDRNRTNQIFDAIVVCALLRHD
jgi:hypothetical protein